MPIAPSFSAPSSMRLRGSATQQSALDWPQSERRYSTMTAKKLMLLAAPAVMMLGAVLGLQGIESWLAAFGTSP